MRAPAPGRRCDHIEAVHRAHDWRGATSTGLGRYYSTRYGDPYWCPGRKWPFLEIRIRPVDELTGALAGLSERFT